MPAGKAVSRLYMLILAAASYVPHFKPTCLSSFAIKHYDMKFSMGNLNKNGRQALQKSVLKVTLSFIVFSKVYGIQCKFNVNMSLPMFLICTLAI